MNRQDGFPVCWNSVFARCQSSKIRGEVVSILARSLQAALLHPFFRRPRRADHFVKEEVDVR
jgi:hypothetical protein